MDQFSRLLGTPSASGTSTVAVAEGIIAVPTAGHSAAPAPEKLYTEADVNKLAARLLKAETKGNSKKAEKLRKKLAMARRSIESQKQGNIPLPPRLKSARLVDAAGEKKNSDESDDEEVIVLATHDEKGRPIRSLSKQQALPRKSTLRVWCCFLHVLSI